jgi:mRNA interferase MazF
LPYRESIKRGDVLFADLDSQSQGSEQAGERYVVVVSNNKCNVHSPVVIVACISASTLHHYLPTHQYADERNGLKRPSTIMYEQLKTIDKRRLVNKVGHLNAKQMQEMNEKLAISVGLNGLYN